MDRENFVRNIKLYCQMKGVKPTVACRESGVGTSFIHNIEAGSVPSVEKVQALAFYLGVRTSDLLGEPPTRPRFETEAENRLLGYYDRLNQEGREKLISNADDLFRSGKYEVDYDSFLKGFMSDDW